MTINDPEYYDEWYASVEPEFLDDGTLVLTNDLLDVLNLDQAELLEDAESAIRWLCGDIAARSLEEASQGSIEVSNEEGQALFGAALQGNAAEIPCPLQVTHAIARAFEVGDDL